MVPFRSAYLAAGLVFAAAPLVLSAEQAHEPVSIATDLKTLNFQVEIADDPRERALGLMYRRNMPEDQGMLFDFQAEQPVSFWMRNTYIPLDMLFIRADGTIDSIAERTTPLSDKSIPSDGPVRYVLEINGGLSDTLGIEPGDVVTGPALEEAE
jgi:uncharacterized membrane protein (UPF0127 family)